jgi:hypothetical protein
METKVSTSQKIEVAITNSTKKQPIKRTSKKVKDNLEFYKEKFGIRLDLLTGEEFIPLKRSQKFANSKNRIRYYNEITNAKNFKIISDYKNAKHEDEQNTNWQQIVIYLIDNKDKLFKDKIEYLMNNYSVTNKNK